MSSTVATAIAAIVTAIASGGLWTYLAARRAASGRVVTTPAETLWQQMQTLLATYQERLDKAETQRDKLLDGYSQIAPTLASIDASLRKLLELELTGQDK